MKLYSVLLKTGEAAALFPESQIDMANLYADLHDGKVMDFNTKKVITGGDYCKEKHFEHLKKTEAMEKGFEKAVLCKDNLREHKYFTLWVKESLLDEM